MRSNFSLQPSSNPAPPLGHHHVNCCLHLKESCVDAESNMPPPAQPISTAPGLGPASVQPAASTVVSVGYGGTTCVNVLHTNPMNQDQNNLSTTKAVVHQWQLNWKKLTGAGEQHNKYEDYGTSHVQFELKSKMWLLFCTKEYWTVNERIPIVYAISIKNHALGDILQTTWLWNFIDVN